MHERCVCACVSVCGRRGSAGFPLVRVPPGICPSSWMTRWSPRLWSIWPESSHQRGAVGRNSNLYLLWTLTLSGCFFPNRRTPRTLQSQQLLPTSTPASSATPLGRCSSSTGVKEGEVGVVAHFYGSFYGPKRPFSKHLLPAHQWDVRSLTSASTRTSFLHFSPPQERKQTLNLSAGIHIQIVIGKRGKSE